jgi:single-stranded DNA-specific DHH superfamily exonuclease
MIGCIGDGYIPDFSKEFTEKYPELFNTDLPISEALYRTEIGRLVKILNFGLKDTTTNVINLIKFLTKAKNIHDITEENSSTEHLHKRYQELNKIYTNLLKEAETKISDSKLLFISYSSKVSMSAELANRLSFKYEDKLVIVANKRQDQVNFSIRGKNARKITLKAIEKIDGATGGGHKQACGASIPEDKLDEFKKNIETLLNQS